MAQQASSSFGLAKSKYLRDLICTLLQSDRMTAKELGACLMSEPYNLEQHHFDLVIDALQHLSADGLLRVDFRKNSDIICLEPVFYVSRSPDRDFDIPF